MVTLGSWSGHFILAWTDLFVVLGPLVFSQPLGAHPSPLPRIERHLTPCLNECFAPGINELYNLTVTSRHSSWLSFVRTSSTIVFTIV